MGSPDHCSQLSAETGGIQCGSGHPACGDQQYTHCGQGRNSTRMGFLNDVKKTNVFEGCAPVPANRAGSSSPSSLAAWLSTGSGCGQPVKSRADHQNDERLSPSRLELRFQFDQPLVAVVGGLCNLRDLLPVDG